MRKSPSNRAALFATAASLFLIAHEARAQERVGASLAALMLGARGPPPPAMASRTLVSLGDWFITPHAAFAVVARPEPPALPARLRPTLVADVRGPGPRPAPVVASASRPAIDPAADPMGALLLTDAAPRALRGGAPASPTQPFPAPDPATLLLLLVQLDDLTLTEGLAAYGAAEDPLLPVGELSRLLELDIDVLPSQGRIVGRLGEARRALVIDLATNTARIGPVEVPLAPGDVAVTPDDIFVRASLLAKLLPLRFAVDPRALQMRVTPLELLPIQGRLQRLARLRQSGSNPTGAPVMRAKTPYKLISPPSFDVALGLGAQTQTPKAPTRYDIRVGGDLFYAGLEAYLGSDDTGRPATSRFLLERRSVEGDLLGPLHARSVDLGDVFTPGLSIGPRSLGGRGFAMSNVPLGQTNVFNRIDLRGELPLGTDVELYVNDVLQGTQAVAERGQYEFLNVPLTQGVNIVRIVTYGPRGQRNEETRIINASGGLLRKGQATLEFGAVDQDEPLFRVRELDPFSADRSLGRPRVIANVNYGLTSYLTLAAGGALYSDHLGVERRLGTAGLRSSVGGFATSLDVAADDQGGEGASVAVAGRILGANTVLRHAEYRGGLLDENNAEADLDRPLRRRTEITVDDNLRFGVRVIPVSIRALRDLYADGGNTWIGQVRGSASLGSILYSTGLEYDRVTAVSGDTSDRARGFISATTFRNYQWQVRGTLDYDLVPDARVTALSVTADRAISNVWSLRLGATQRFDAPKGLELIAGSTTRTRFGDLALTGQYDTTDSSWRLGAQMNFGIGYNPETHGYQLTRTGPGSGGSVVFHAFIDENGDGRFDPGERGVANVSLEGGEQKARTDAGGRAYLSGFGSAPTARLLVGLAEIDNPAVKTPPTIVEFAPRPGGVAEIDFPMRPTGEVMVNLKLRRPDGQLVGLSATRLRLVNGRGEVVEGITEFDGSVNFLDLPAGTYALQLDAEQAQRLRMRLTAPVSVTIRPDGSVNPDVNAEVQFESRPDGDVRPPG